MSGSMCGSGGNIPEELSREVMLLGESAVKRLINATVALFGVGGVGGTCAEALCRSGIGHIILIDGDSVARSNLNRQLIATQATIGRRKVEAARERLLSINPDMRVDAMDIFCDAGNIDTVPLSQCDMVIDAIDTVTSKLLIIECCHELGVPVISCMGAGNKLDPSRFEVSDIAKTSMCPLARVMRKELRARGIEHLPVVYSREPALSPINGNTDDTSGQPDMAHRPHVKQTPGSAAFCAPAAGLLAAAEAVRLLIAEQ